MSFINYSLKNNPKLNQISEDFFALGPTPYPTLSIATNYSVSENKISENQTSGNIEVLSPVANDAVKSGFAVMGNARTKDNVVFIRLLDSSGNILIETTTLANSSSSVSYGPFEKLITFYSEDSSGKLDVFQLDTNNGRLRDVVTIPLIFN